MSIDLNNPAVLDNAVAAAEAIQNVSAGNVCTSDELAELEDVAPGTRQLGRVLARITNTALNRGYLTPETALPFLAMTAEVWMEMNFNGEL